MRKILNVLMLVLATVFCTSCLEGGLEDLPLAGDADIISVRAVSHRIVGLAVTKNPQAVKIK